jgi:enoyl-CoA hydratase/carnithine racemase
MFMPAARLGLHYYRSGLERYVARLGLDNAKRLFLTAEKLDARQMKEVGFLTHLVQADKLEEEVIAPGADLRGHGSDRHARHEASPQPDRARDAARGGP